MQYDKPSVIYEQPKDAFVASFLGKANFMQGTIKAGKDGKYSFEMDRGSMIEIGVSQDLAAGSQYTLAVRPEKISISPTWTESTPIKGIITLVTYAGGITDYTVQALNRDWIIQTQNATTNGAVIPVGGEVWFGWQAENTLVL